QRAPYGSWKSPNGLSAGPRALADFADDPRRIASDDQSLRHVPSHNCASADQRIGADAHRQNNRAASDNHTMADIRRQTGPLIATDQTAILIGGAWKQIVGECYAMTDKDFVGDLDALANKGMRLNLAALADDRTTLDFHERSNARFRPNPATIEV